jgi:hypothetical protein
LAAVHASPAFRILACIAPSTAEARSASRSTKKGALPPNSIDALLRTGGVFLGAAAAFDWFYLGKTLETVPLPARRGTQSTWTWAPSVAAGEDGLQVGISGAF